jgi:hypothetical protein
MLHLVQNKNRHYIDQGYGKESSLFGSLPVRHEHCKTCAAEMTSQQLSKEEIETHIQGNF